MSEKPEASLRRTPLNSVHREMGARMVSFGGWDMPVQYSSIKEEHMTVREKVGLFDVSHMGEIEVAGTNALDSVQHLTPNDASKLKPGRAQYTALTTPQGTFIDDSVVYCLEEDRYLFCVNASNIEKDFAWIKENALTGSIVTNRSDETGQIAVQGPEAVDLVASLSDDAVRKLRPFRYAKTEVAGHMAIVSRTGYTGEDGFELYLDAEKAEPVWRRLMEEGASRGIRAAGLGARDTLRLEARLALYGNDIDETTTVLEAGLGWIVKPQKGDFLGREVLVRQIEHGVENSLVGFEVLDKGIARHGHPVIVDGDQVGRVTSGTRTPYVDKPIGLAYVPVKHSEVGCSLQIRIRDREVAARVVETPFYKRERSR